MYCGYYCAVNNTLVHVNEIQEKRYIQNCKWRICKIHINLLKPSGNFTYDQA
jgi:hypothetical protein